MIHSNMIKACAVVLTLLTCAGPLHAQQDRNAPPGLSPDTAKAIVGLRAHIAPEGQSTETLGQTRTGNGVIVDASGLVVTIGYLITESYAIEVTLADGTQVPATFVGFDSETGFGLLRAELPAGIKPMRLGDSDQATEGSVALVLASDGPMPVHAVKVVSRRDFAGWWEYLLESAIFTSPPQPYFGGAALVGSDGRLLGIGSLMVGDAGVTQSPAPGNMFVPINRLKPLLADLIDRGRPAAKGRPWLGVTTKDSPYGVLVERTRKDGPAEKAGIRPRDIIVGVGDSTVKDTLGYLRRVFALGEAGVTVPLMVLRVEGTAPTVRRIEVPSASRYDYMRAARGI